MEKSIEQILEEFEDYDAFKAKAAEDNVRLRLIESVADEQFKKTYAVAKLIQTLGAMESTDLLLAEIRSMGTTLHKIIKITMRRAKIDADQVTVSKVLREIE